jgi:hypothetical protein
MHFISYNNIIIMLNNVINQCLKLTIKSKFFKNVFQLSIINILINLLINLLKK